MAADLAELLDRFGLPMGPEAFERLLTRALADPTPLQYGPRGLADYMAVIEYGLSVREAAQHLSVSSSRVRERLRERSLYGVKVDRAWMLPGFQFADGRPLPGLREVISRVDRRAHPVSVHYFFMRPRPELKLPGTKQKMSPRDWLLLGLPHRFVSSLAGTLEDT